MAYEGFYYVGFRYGEGTRLNIDTQHEHVDGAEERPLLAEKVDGRPTNHLGYTVIFLNEDKSTALPPAHEDFVHEAISLIVVTFQKDGTELLDRAQVTTVPVPVIGNDNLTAEPHDMKVVFGKSMTLLTYRLPCSAHQDARRIVRALDKKLTLFNI